MRWMNIQSWIFQQGVQNNATLITIFPPEAENGKIKGKNFKLVYGKFYFILECWILSLDFFNFPFKKIKFDFLNLNFIKWNLWLTHGIWNFTLWINDLHFCNMKCQVWNYYFYLWKNHFFSATWNIKSEIIIFPLDKSFLLLQPDNFKSEIIILLLEFVFFYCNLKCQFWNYNFITSTWNFNSEIIILPLKGIFITTTWNFNFEIIILHLEILCLLL